MENEDEEIMLAVTEELGRFEEIFSEAVYPI